MATLDQPEPFEIIVLLGNHLDGKHYDELLRNAQNLYSDFLEQNKNLSTLSDIINELELG